MGVRIYAYGIDLPRLDAFLDTSLRDLIGRYYREGDDSRDRLYLNDRETNDAFLVVPGRFIRGAITGKGGRACSEFTDAQLPEIPLVERSVREHLSGNSNYQSYWVVNALSTCTRIDFVHRLIDGQRRWWIGSVLQFVQDSVHDQETYNELVHLFGRVLRGFDCGHPVFAADVGIVTDGLPFTPEEDPDIRVGRWSEQETSAAVEILSNVLSSSPTFTPPRGPLGIVPDDSEWQEWVHGNVAALLSVGDLDYAERNVLTYIE